MGRKPNPMIIRHFNRGAKLNDSSNRYAHTCKSCGEKFPKGRIDSLISHITKKCNAISHADRRKALLEANGLSDDGIRSTYNTQLQMDEQQHNVQDGSGGWNGLQTLAEVARSYRTEPLDGQLGVQHPSAIPPHPNRLKLQEQYTLDNPPVSYEQRSQRDKKLVEQKQARHLERNSPLHVQDNQLFTSIPLLHPAHPPLVHKSHPNYFVDTPLTDPHFQPSSRSTTPVLAAAATSVARGSAAQASIAQSSLQTAASYVPNMVDPALLRDDTDIGGDVDMSNHDSFGSMESVIHETIEGRLREAGSAMGMSSAQGQDYFTSNSGLEQNLHWAESSNIHHTPAPTEVISRQGQPIQHKLKLIAIHPAASTPAAPLTTAPLPLGPLTTEFSVEPGNGQRLTNKQKSRAKFSDDRRIEVQSIRKMGACIRCRVLKKPCSGGTPCETCKHVEAARVWKLDCSRKRLKDKMDMYAKGMHAALARNALSLVQKTMTQSSVQIEASHYPKTGIFLVMKASEIHILSDSIEPSLNGHFGGRHGYIIDGDAEDVNAKIGQYTEAMRSEFTSREQSSFIKVTLQTAIDLCHKDRVGEDVLVQHVVILRCALDLWATVHMLIDHEMKWILSEKHLSLVAPGTGPSINHGETTYNIIAKQLASTLEKRAAELSKSALGKIESVLLAPGAKRSFELFLAGILLLNCLEKSTWLFQFWEQDNFLDQWPIAEKPSALVEQGREVTSMLNFLLRMKEMTASEVVVSPEGILGTCYSEPMKVYYEKIDLKEVHVVTARDGRQFNPLDSRCFDLHFCSRLLLKDRDSIK